MPGTGYALVVLCLVVVPRQHHKQDQKAKDQQKHSFLASDSRLCWFLRMVTCVCLHRSSVTFVSVYGAADLDATSSSTADAAGYGSESTGSKS